MSKVNIDKVKAKVEEERAKASRRNFERTRWWKPKNGDNPIRLMPPWTDEGPNADQFWREEYRHWKVGEGGYDEENGLNFTCPVKTPDGEGDSCEVCDLVTAYRASGETGKLEVAKKLAAKQRLYSNVVDLNDPVWTESDIDEWKEGRPDSECPHEPGDTKVQVWSYGSTIFKQLLDVFADGIDLTSFDEDSLVVTREGKSLTTKYRVRTKRNKEAFEFVGSGTVREALFNLDDLSNFPEDGAMAKALAGESSSFGTTTAPSLPAANTEVGDEYMSESAKALQEKMLAASAK